MSLQARLNRQALSLCPRIETLMESLTDETEVGNLWAIFLRALSMSYVALDKMNQDELNALQCNVIERFNHLNECDHFYKCHINETSIVSK